MIDHDEYGRRFVIDFMMINDLRKAHAMAACRGRYAAVGLFVPMRISLA
jgi:hypothetical protein